VLPVQAAQGGATPTVGATSATYAAAIASIANPQFQALIASIAGLQGRFDEE
jgi:hypothetical protein